MVLVVILVSGNIVFRKVKRNKRNTVSELFVLFVVVYVEVVEDQMWIAIQGYIEFFGSFFVAFGNLLLRFGIVLLWFGLVGLLFRKIIKNILVGIIIVCSYFSVFKFYKNLVYFIGGLWNYKLDRKNLKLRRCQKIIYIFIDICLFVLGIVELFQRF